MLTSVILRVCKCPVFLEAGFYLMAMNNIDKRFSLHLM